MKEGGAQALVSLGKKGTYEVTFQRSSGLKAKALHPYTDPGKALEAAKQFLRDTPKFTKEPYEVRLLGGSGSGNYGHSGRPGEKGGSAKDSEKAQRALAAHNPFNKKKEALATKNENQMVAFTGGSGTDNNAPMDIIVKHAGKTYGMEVKTMMDNKASKVTMRKDAMQRKVAWARSNHASLHTVVIDDRKAFGHKNLYSGHRIYYAKGIGSFRLAGMTKVRDAAHLRDLLQGKKGTLRNAGSQGGSSEKGQKALKELSADRMGMIDTLYIVDGHHRAAAAILSGAKTVSVRLHKFEDVTKFRAAGGKGSGNFNHAGRPGERGGSSSESGSWPEGLTKLSSAKGSNPGGLYQDASGQKWYVKHYRDERQAASEHISNQVYRDLGLGAPISVLGADGQYASKWMDEKVQTLGQHGVTKEVADKILDGFAADVFLMNWDAVGTGHDNILVSKSGGLTRVDQGGTLLFRAQGGLKPESLLNSVGEWRTLRDQNPWYAKVFQAAGVRSGDALGKRAVEQIARISALRPSTGWRTYVDKLAPTSPISYRSRVASMLESRQKGLEEIAKRLSTPRTLGGSGSGNFGHAGRPGEVGGSSDDGGTSQGVSASSIGKITSKQKHTKDQIQTAWQMKQSGATGAAIQKATGLHPSTQYHHFKKMEAKKGEYAKVLKNVPKGPAGTQMWHGEQTTITLLPDKSGYVLTDKYGGVLHTGEYLDDMLKEAEHYEPAAIPIPTTLDLAEQKSPGMNGEELNSSKKKEVIAGKTGGKYAGAHYYWKKGPDGKYVKTLTTAGKAALGAKASQTPHEPIPSSNPSYVPKESKGDLTAQAVKNGYEWKSKASGPNTGQYAWFKDGVQVSKPTPWTVGDQAASDAAAASMHYGEGPKSNTFEPAPTPDGWPVSNNVTRVEGENYPRIMAKVGNEWRAKLTPEEHHAVGSYTGSAYSSINSKLWESPKIEKGSTADTIQKALAKAPEPPPPELVWRGLSGGGAKVFANLSPGDEFPLNGFQSTSIKPGFAASWGGKLVLEIKPKAGAYVQAVSSHKSEKEFLLPHGSKFRMVGTSQVKLEGGKIKNVVQLEML